MQAPEQNFSTKGIGTARKRAFHAHNTPIYHVLSNVAVYWMMWMKSVT